MLHDPRPWWPLTDADDLREELVAAYASPQRGYHDVQHLVEAIMACDVSAKVAPASSHRNPDFWRARGRNYLERYCYLVLFAAYALEHAPTNYAASFSEWAHHRWQLKRVLKHMTLEG